jgi:hypothetical protein
VAQQLSQALQAHVDRWLASGLPDNGVESPYTTAASVQVLVDCVEDAA